MNEITPRILKFRVWDDKNQKMIHNPKSFEIIKIYNNTDELIYKFDYCFYTKPEFVQQFTGLLDKNGKEIYEGDILYTNFGEEDNEDDPFREICSEVYQSKSGAWRFNSEHLIYYRDYCEVVGNIFENPELLAAQS